MKFRMPGAQQSPPQVALPRPPRLPSPRTARPPSGQPEIVHPLRRAAIIASTGPRNRLAAAAPRPRAPDNRNSCRLASPCRRMKTVRIRSPRSTAGRLRHADAEGQHKGALAKAHLEPETRPRRSFLSRLRDECGTPDRRDRHATPLEGRTPRPSLTHQSNRRLESVGQAPAPWYRLLIRAYHQQTSRRYYCP